MLLRIKARFPGFFKSLSGLHLYVDECLAIYQLCLFKFVLCLTQIKSCKKRCIINIILKFKTAFYISLFVVLC